MSRTGCLGYLICILPSSFGLWRPRPSWSNRNTVYNEVIAYVHFGDPLVISNTLHKFKSVYASDLRNKNWRRSLRYRLLILSVLAFAIPATTMRLWLRLLLLQGSFPLFQFRIPLFLLVVVGFMDHGQPRPQFRFANFCVPCRSSTSLIMRHQTCIFDLWLVVVRLL